MIQWHSLHDMEQLEVIDDLSRNQLVLIFKHSTRCSISSIAKSRLESDWDFSNKSIIPFQLDLISNREISNQLAENYHVYHESPQVLLISSGQCVVNLSHLDITYDNIMSKIETQQLS